MPSIHTTLLYYFILLAFTPYHYLTGAPVVPMLNTELNAHVIFDLGGVLINTNTLNLLWNLGPTQLTLYSLSTGKSPYSLKQTLYTIMNTVERQYNRNAISYDDEGLSLPSIMHNWLSGKQTNKQILNTLTNAIVHHPEWFANYIEQNIMQQFVKILFTPTHFVTTRTFIQEGINLVKWCKKQGFKVYVLSNWDTESFTVLRAQHPYIFNLFDGIIISGDHNCLKPDPKLYQILLKKFNLSACDCIMIDDRIENILTARALHMHGIHYVSCSNNADNHDFNTIKKEIRAWAKHTQKY